MTLLVEYGPFNKDVIYEACSSCWIVDIGNDNDNGDDDDNDDDDGDSHSSIGQPFFLMNFSAPLTAAVDDDDDDDNNDDDNDDFFTDSSTKSWSRLKIAVNFTFLCHRGYPASTSR